MCIINVCYNVVCWLLFHTYLIIKVFSDAQRFNASLRSWDVSRVTDMGYSKHICILICDIVHNPSYHSASYHNILCWLFYHIIIQSKFIVFMKSQQFNAPLTTWDVSKVTDMKFSEYIRLHMLNVEHDILVYHHTNVALLLTNLNHHPQCFGMLNISMLLSDHGMWVGWLTCKTVSIVYLYDIVYKPSYQNAILTLTTDSFTSQCSKRPPNSDESSAVQPGIPSRLRA